MAVLDVRFDIFLVRFDISRPIRHSVLPPPLGLKPSQARASNQCRASNRQTRASNNHNALHMNVIVIFFWIRVTLIIPKISIMKFTHQSPVFGKIVQTSEARTLARF